MSQMSQWPTTHVVLVYGVHPPTTPEAVFRVPTASESVSRAPFEVSIYETDCKIKGPCIENGNLIAETAMMTLEGKKIIVTGMSKHLENPVTAIARPYYRLLYS